MIGTTKFFINGQEAPDGAPVVLKRGDKWSFRYDVDDPPPGLNVRFSVTFIPMLLNPKSRSLFACVKTAINNATRRVK